ncbi:MAG: DNA topoisomerase 3 [Desulfotalea sp.]
MIKKLYIAEKPSLGRAIAEEIGVVKKGQGWLSCKDGICITWCVGHMYTLHTPDHYNESLKKWNINHLPFIPQKFERKFSSTRIKPQIKIIKGLLQKTEIVVNAGDPDREGQIIVDEVLDELNWQGQVERIWIKALNSKSLKTAINNLKPNTDYKGFSDSAVGRSRADWVVGMNYTRAFTVLAQQRGHEGVFSVGRVQTPTLEMVVRRDLEIEDFKKQEHFVVEAEFKVENGQYKGTWQIPEAKGDSEGRCLSKDVAEQVIESTKEQISTIIKVDAKKKQTLVELPFSLSSLQVYCNKKYGFGAKEVLDLAQSLYEKHKATTYPRTDCNYLEENDFADLKETLNAITAADHSTMREFMNYCSIEKMPKCYNSKKVTAHTAIVPTTEPPDISKMNPNELQVYDAVRRRFVAQFMPPYVYKSTIVLTECASEQFKSTGNIMLDKGWKVIMDDADKKDKLLPELTKNEQGICVDGKPIQKFTSPPKRYTEGLLIADMENIAKYVEDTQAKKMLKSESVKGIGTEATRANIIEGLKQREYVTEKGKTLISTEKARKFIKVLPAEIKDPVTTANWEYLLSDVSDGKLTLDAFGQQINSWVTREIEKLKSNPNQYIPEIERDIIPCPTCGRELKRWKSKKGEFFWGCIGFSDEQNTCKRSFPDEKGKPNFNYKPPSNGGKKYLCKKCGEELIARNGNPPFWGCGGYYNAENQCRQTYTDKDGEPDFTPAQFLCKKCNEPLIRRKSKKGEGFWWGCSGYSQGCKQTYSDKNGEPQY